MSSFAKGVSTVVVFAVGLVLGLGAVKLDMIFKAASPQQNRLEIFNDGYKLYMHQIQGHDYIVYSRGGAPVHAESCSCKILKRK